MEYMYIILDLYLCGEGVLQKVKLVLSWFYEFLHIKLFEFYV